MAHQGMTTWYENSGPWWEDSSLQDTIVPAAAEEQITDPGSLWKYYQLLIQLKKKHPALAYGEYKMLDNDSAGILSFLRISKKQTCMVLINLSDTKERAYIDVEASTGKKTTLFRSILGNMHVKPAVKNVYVDMESFGTGVWECQNVKSSE
jgi:glycosidase